jgi:hypothetical protein
MEADSAAAGQEVSVENRFGFLRTHPTSEFRQKTLEKDMPKALKIWRDHFPRRPSQAGQEQGMPAEKKGRELPKETVQAASLE